MSGDLLASNGVVCETSHLEFEFGISEGWIDMRNEGQWVDGEDIRDDGFSSSIEIGCCAWECRPKGADRQNTGCAL